MWRGCKDLQVWKVAQTIWSRSGAAEAQEPDGTWEVLDWSSSILYQVPSPRLGEWTCGVGPTSCHPGTPSPQTRRFSYRESRLEDRCLHRWCGKQSRWHPR